MTRIPTSVAIVALALLTAPLVIAQSQTGLDARDDARRRLQAASGGAAEIANHDATNTSRFIRAGNGGTLSPVVAPTANAKEQQSRAFFRDYGPLLGVADASAMRLVESTTDALGETHLVWKQFYGQVPVFGGTMKTHFDRSQRLKAVTGIAIPDISVGVVPAWPRERAAETARADVVAARGNNAALRVGRSTLYIYREGLAQGAPGPNHLAWEIEILDGAGVRDLVYVDAQSGKVIDRIAAVHDDLFRRAYDGRDLPNPPANYPRGAYWLEDQTFPTASEEANNMMLASFDIYKLFQRAFGRDSFNGTGGIMDAIFDRGYDCPNASWNGQFISFCPGLTTDDVTAHEWGHAYTQYTHNLIYQWQPGALNEAYSDIWGELVDQINERGTDLPGDARTAGSCSAFSPPVAQLVIAAPAAIAGAYFAQSASFGPRLSAPVTGSVAAALDAADAAGPSSLDACSTITNPAQVSGKIALVNRGACEFSTKVLNAQQAGAVAVIVANNVATGLPGMGPGVDAPLVTIPSVGVQQQTGNSIRTQLTAGTTVSATLQATPGSDSSYKWLLGEDAADGGAIRDMWNPTCYGNPGKVSDTAQYACSAGDQGGVHTNSGIPNHTFALLVDGGSYNGQSISPIGLTKAAHIYYRAQSTYQVESSGFADHADALEQSCLDLVGRPLNALTGGPSSESISAADCTQVTNAIAATELRVAPTFCNFGTLLNPALPAFCSTVTTTGITNLITSFDFEAGADDWTATRANTSADFTPRDWSLVSSLPAPKTGTAFFAPNPNIGTCAPGGDESGVLELTSPEILLPSSTSFARAAFEHWFATEPGFDGTNLQVSVNGGPFQPIQVGDITFNNYIAFLLPAADGNTNPLAGQPAWTGANPGAINAGSWGRTHLDLDRFAKAGDRIRLRWSLGSDGCAGRVGTFVDNVTIFSCTPKAPDLSIADLNITEGNAGSTEALFRVFLSTPTIRPVTFFYETVEETATHGNDFDRVSGVAVIPAGATQVRIPVTIKGDVVREGVETFRIRILGASGAAIVDSEAVGTIGEDDVRPGPPHD